MNNNHCVYFHKNKINGKMYIGQCKGAAERRWRSNGDGYINKCPKFSDAIKKYGWDNFEHGILKEKLTLDEANYWEEYYIQYYHTWVDDPECWGYNLQKGGKNTLMAEETKRKLSIINSGENHPQYGLYRFKKGFGAEFTEFIGEIYIPFKPLTYSLYKFSEKTFRNLRALKTKFKK